jgi:hypothetical protein
MHVLADSALVLLPTALLTAGVPVPLFAGLWLVLSAVIGFLIGRWWVVLLGPVPWLLGLPTGLALGRYIYLGEGWWQVGLIWGVLPGVIGVCAGVVWRATRAAGQDSLLVIGERDI